MYIKQPQVPDDSLLQIAIGWYTLPHETIYIGNQPMHNTHGTCLNIALRVPDDRSDKTRIEVHRGE